jgi:hypothetical protein
MTPAVIMLTTRSSCFACGHHAHHAVIMLRLRSSCFAKKLNLTR